MARTEREEIKLRMSEANKALVRRLYDEINARNLGVFDAVVDDSFVEHEDNGLPPTKDGVKTFFETVLAAFPDFKMTPQQVIAESDLVSVYLTATGTHRGEFLGIPATNKSVSVNVFDLMRVQNGKITEHWGITDNASLMQQLGVGPT
jgi:steroid delta-isomerase-like uncharacterized protein